VDTNSEFTFKKIEGHFQIALDNGYKFFTCEEYNDTRRISHIHKILINRVDVDFSIKKAEKLGIIFNNLGVKGTFFIRLHAPEYNPFSFENYRIIKYLIESGHEIGYHSEIIDESVIWAEEPVACLQRDIQVLNKMFDINIAGTASHGGMTGLNNLDFWKNRSAINFGLKYEAYDWFDDTFYVSDSEWTRWKCYENGKIVSGDFRNLAQHVQNNHKVLYSLIHSDTYYHKHFYEDE
jgi:hypothetical protein